MTEPRVFVVHETLRRETDPVTNHTEWVRTRDVTVARKFGNLQYIYPAGRLVGDPEYLVRVAREKLADFTSNDYLLLSGDTAAMAVASIVAAQRLTDSRRLKLLLWDNRINGYYEVAPEVWEEDVQVLDPVQ